MSHTKKCEVCGLELPESEFSKSYKKRCKKCVAEMTRAKRKKEPSIEALHQIERTTVSVAMMELVDAVNNLAVALKNYSDSLLTKIKIVGKQ